MEVEPLGQKLPWLVILAIIGGGVVAVERALAFHQCDAGSISWPTVIYGLSLLLLFSVVRGFSPSTVVFPTHQKPTFDLICGDSLWFVSPITKACVPGYKKWNLNKIVIVITI